MFNVGETYYGTTAAGYAVVLAAISFFGSELAKLFGFGTSALFDVPSVAVALSAIALATIAALLPVIARARAGWRHWTVSVMGAVFLFSSVPFNEVAGHETYPFLATALLGTVLVGYFRAYLLGGFSLAVAATFRPDAVLLAGIVLAIDWIRSDMTICDYLKKLRVIGFVVVYTIILSSWLVYLAYHFGSPIPGTMAAKRTQVLLGYWPLYTPSTLIKYILSRVSWLGIFLVFVGIASFICGTRLKISSKVEVTNQFISKASL